MAGERIPIESAKQLMKLMMEYYMGAKMAEQTDQKIAWVTSGAPVELLHAAGVIPIYPENHAALCAAQKAAVGLCEAAEERGFSRDLCSYARTEIGSYLTKSGPMGGLPKPDFLLCCNNICGTVTKWYQELQRHFDVPLFFIDAPFIHGEATTDTLDYVHAQIKDVVAGITEIIGKPIEDDVLHDTLVLAAKATSLWSDLLDLLAHRPSPMSSFDTFVHIAPIVVMRGEQRCIDYYEGLTAEIRDRIANGIAAVPGEQFRLGWDNLPVWFKMGALSKRFSQHKACLAAATYASAWAQMIDPEAVDDMLREMARAYLMVYINCGLEKRLDTLLHMVDKFSLDGVVMHSDRSCKAYSLGQYELAKTLRENHDIPTLVLEADMNDSRVYAEEQINARIDAFMETLAAR
ncbi:MAG: 2-hydroxyglutaryl-CoA dehydratase [Nitrospiraceae bacterium]|nr:2-hydroxyglutaryl-CoA dehydratase [Nitrospiraceae bacterium]